MSDLAVGTSDSVARDLASRFCSREKTAQAAGLQEAAGDLLNRAKEKIQELVEGLPRAVVRGTHGSMNESVPGAYSPAATALLKSSAALMTRRPKRVMPSLPHADPPKFTTEAYTPGALERYLTKEAGDRHFQVTVRTGREATGHLPSPPEMTDRIQEADSVSGAVERLLLARDGTKAPVPKPAEKKEEEKTASGTDDIVSGMAGQNRMPQGMFGPVGSTVDYVSRGLMGTGLGRTIGFLMKGRGMPEAIERRLSMAGAAGGLGLAALSHHEANKMVAKREALMGALADFDARRQALAQEARDLKKLVQGGEQVRGRVPRSYDLPEPERRHEGSGMRDTTLAALVGGAGGAIGENMVGALRSRLGRAARAGGAI